MERQNPLRAFFARLGQLFTGTAPPSSAQDGSPGTTPAAGTVVLDPRARLQVVEGWGTSLCWWAVVTGTWSDPARGQLADLLFDPARGLGLNIVRYNIGGGDDPAHNHMRVGGAVPGYQPRQGEWDWTWDAGQRWMLSAATQRGAGIAEAFSNSPPYWMTRSGCSAGAGDAGDNLRADAVDLYSAYLAEVVAHFAAEWGVTFRTVEAFNEPLQTNWQSMHGQEGCHWSRPLQALVISSLSAALARRGVATAIATDDEFRVDDLLDTFASYGPRVQALVAQLNTHSYSASRRPEVSAMAAAAGKRLWMSEWGGSRGPHDHQAMDTPLLLSNQIRTDMSRLRPTAWVYWQAVEQEANHNWGFIHADLAGTTEQISITKSYYAMGQYSRFIRPGFTLIQSTGATLAAFDEATHTVVTVCENAGATETTLTLDLHAFGLSGDGSLSAAFTRTSETEDMASLPAFPLQGGVLNLTLPARSITTVVVAPSAS